MNIIGTVIRSIIYKIPLKLLLILVAVFGVLFACFSSAENVENLIHYVDEGNITVQSNNNTMLYNIDSSDYGIYCVDISNYSSDYVYIQLSRFSYPSEIPNVGNYLNVYADQVPGLFCIYVNQPYLGFRNINSDSVNFDYKLFSLDVLLGTNIPVMNSIQCQTQYNLIPISEVDSAYCEENNLCSSSDLTPGVSNIFINDIFHPGAYNIIMNIPEEIDRDYTYTNSGSNFNLDVVGYNQDEEYIQSVIDVQNYKPTSEDFTRVFSNISNFGALLIACLFVILVFYMIKKAFK